MTPAGALTASNATITGTVTASAGSIGGWAINSSYLGATNVGLAPADFPFYAGAAYDFRSSAPFRVTTAGVLTATSGSVGGWTLGANSLAGGNATLHNSGYLSLGTGNDIARLDAADATYRLWAGHTTAASAPFRVTKAGALTASNANITGTINATAGNFTGSVYVGVAAPRIHIDGVNKRIESTNFASGTSGFRIEGETGNAEFNNVVLRGVLTATAIQYGYVLATNGSIVVVKAAGRSLNSFSAPKEGIGTLDIEDPDGMTHAAAGGLWAVNDVIRLQEPLAGDFWGAVTAKTDMTTYWQLAVEDRSTSGNGTFPAGAAVLNYGQSGDGVVRITADASNSPYISIATHAGSPWLSLTERARLGNLTGVSGASGYGLWTDNGYFTGAVNASAGAIGGWTIASGHLYAGSGSNRAGLQPASYPFYAGSETPASAPFRVTPAGALTAIAGNIAGWTLATTRLSWNDGNQGIGMATYNDTDGFAFWAGDYRPAYAEFRVSNNGALFASSATITGSITANSGSIAGALTMGGSGSISDGSNFKLDAGGLILATGVTNAFTFKSGLTGGTYAQIYSNGSSGLNVDGTAYPLYLNSGQNLSLNASAGSSSYALLLKANGGTVVEVQPNELGFFGATPVTRPAAYTFTNGTTDRTINCDSTTVAELADVVYTLWSDLRNLGLLQ